MGYDEMEVPVVEIVRGENQSEDDFERDLAVWSVGENEQRKSFTESEKLAIVKRLKDLKTPASRAASALGISDTQYRRFDRIVKYPWMHKAVVDECIGTTDASKLLEEADKVNWTEGLRRNLLQWIEEREQDLEVERAEKAKLRKKLTGSANKVKKYLNGDLVRHWLRCIGSKMDFDDGVDFPFGVVVKDTSISIPAVNTEADKLHSSHLEKMIGELQDGARRLIPLLRQRRMIEAATEVSDEETEAELRRIEEERRREEAEQKKAEAGRPAPNFDQVKEPAPLDMAEEIRQQREASEAEETEGAEV